MKQKHIRRTIDAYQILSLILQHEELWIHAEENSLSTQEMKEKNAKVIIPCENDTKKLIWLADLLVKIDPDVKTSAFAMTTYLSFAYTFRDKLHAMGYIRMSNKEEYDELKKEGVTF